MAVVSPRIALLLPGWPWVALVLAVLPGTVEPASPVMRLPDGMEPVDKDETERTDAGRLICSTDALCSAPAPGCCCVLEADVEGL